MHAARTKVVACATVIEEMTPLLPPGTETQVLDFGLHLKPEELRRSLQQSIDASEGRFDTILLGYGLCSHAVLGLCSKSCTLVMPRVDDCIAIFLGSRADYLRQSRREPGTYYLTKGWIEVGDSPFQQHEQLVRKYGEERARRMTRLMLKNYTRLVFIRTGSTDLEAHRQYARDASAEFGLRFEELDGSPALVRKVIHGPWDDEILVVPPGKVVCYRDFQRTSDQGELHVEGSD